MISIKTILIVDDNKDLRDQLVRLTRQVIPDWKILEADSYLNAIKIININNGINILVSDLYLKLNEDMDSEIGVPSGIRLAKKLRQQQVDCFIYIVSSNLKSLISRNQLIEYIDIGINDFLDRNVDPYEKFSQKFQYQLQKVDQSIISINSFTYKFWQAQDIKTYESFWILILDINENYYNNFIVDCIIWEKNLPEPGAAFSLLSIYDPRTSYLQHSYILNDTTSYPILLISDTPQLVNVIKISSKTLDIIRNESISQQRDYSKQLLNNIHKKIRSGSTIYEIKNEIKIPKFWNWLNLDNIIGFSLESGSLELSDDSNIIAGSRTININNGNYNEKIHGNYLEVYSNKAPSQTKSFITIIVVLIISVLIILQL